MRQSPRLRNRRLHSEGRIIAFTEKPENPATDLANAGLYIVDGALYREIARQGAFDLGFDVLSGLWGGGGWVWGGYDLDIGTPRALEQARANAPGSSRSTLPCAGPRPAVFLDRDGTLIKHVHYLSDPAHLVVCARGGRGGEKLPPGRLGRFWSPMGSGLAGA